MVWCHQYEGREVDRAQSASVESIPEVLEDRDLLADQSDSASVHDMDYVNPRGVRFTQSTQREGKRNSVPTIQYFKALIYSHLAVKFFSRSSFGCQKNCKPTSQCRSCY